MADEQLWPTPRYAEEIVFEGRARLAIAPEEYEALYNAHEALRAQLEQAQAEQDALKVANDNARSAITIWMQTDAQLRTTLAHQRAWIETAGHRPGCPALACDICGVLELECGNVWASNDPPRTHDFQPGPCDCGYDEVTRNDGQAQTELDKLRDVVNEVHAWIVCAGITSPDDMMQNAEHIESICRTVLKG